MKKTIIIHSESIGRGDDDVGRKIMGSFLRKLAVEQNRPEQIIFFNSGVKLLAEGSPVLDAVDMLQQAGIRLLACGTCVNSFGLAEKIEQELISDMRTLVSKLMNSDSVITI